MRDKVYIVGCGPGDPELLTLKAYKVLREAEVLLYTGSLLSRDILDIAERAELKIDTHGLSSEHIAGIMAYFCKKGKLVVWAHDGDPTIYGGLWKIMVILRELGVNYEIIPGVSSVNASAARLGVELTVPYYAQSVTIARLSIRAPVRPEEKLSRLAATRSTLVILLGAHAPDKVMKELLEAGLQKDEPVAVVYHATWRDEKIIICRLEELPRKLREHGVTRCATMIVGPPVRALMGIIRPRENTLVYDLHARRRA